ncbi:MAG: response regulator transcription factor [Candidatus Gastranaerophilales bacterium]|nr:response regulator transcription factor [Candidatus Gastranaerophilales bacterium]
MSIKVLLVDDHELTRKGIEYGLKLDSKFLVVGSVDNGKKAVAFVRQNQPDVILMDIGMPIMNGIDATREIHNVYPDIKVVVLTSMTEKQSVIGAFHSGANAYCMKDAPIDELIKVINTVLNGAVWISPSVAQYVVEILQSNSFMVHSEIESSVDYNLTARELEILKYIADGKSNKEIADSLFLSLYTVKNHVKNVIQKLSVSDRTQAAVLALKDNII